jgi:hypothetical protein
MTAKELERLRERARSTFGSVELAALHHLMGASGTAPNVPGKPVFSFWTRRLDVAVDRLSSPSFDTRGVLPIVISSQVAAGPWVVSALDTGLYEELIGVDAYTFEDFLPEDEVLAAEPVRPDSIDLYDRSAKVR